MQIRKVAHDGINGGPLPQGVLGSTVVESKHACQELRIYQKIRCVTKMCILDMTQRIRVPNACTNNCEAQS